LPVVDATSPAARPAVAAASAAARPAAAVASAARSIAWSIACSTFSAASADFSLASAAASSARSRFSLASSRKPFDVLLHATATVASATAPIQVVNFDVDFAVDLIGAASFMLESTSDDLEASAVPENR
jgi:hypothetical protein